jgi:ATP-dependent helicase/nuclease subunit A
MSADEQARDAEARRLAQTSFGSPLVLEAGAGTGKTATLVARVLSWCLGPGWARAAQEVSGEEAVARRSLEGVVAITFTDAAAAEMAERVGLALGAIERGGPAPPGLDLALLEPSDEDERRARARALLSSLDRLTVRTIHAFCLRLLSEHPLEAGLAPRFEVDADGSASEEFAREAVEEALREESELRRALLELAVRDVQPEAVVGAVSRLAGEGVPPEEIARDRFPPERVSELQRVFREGLRTFFAIERGRLRGNGKGLAVTMRALDGLEALDRALADGELERGELAEAVATHAAEMKRLAAWAVGNFNASEAKRLADDAAMAGEAIASAVAALDELVRARLPVLDAARVALAPLVETTRRRLHESGLATYSDLLRMARDLLRDHAAIRQVERKRLQQLLVDEFQDTDAVQCELVALLGLPEAEGGRSPGLFLVGDPKQSIYGWRSADLAAYDAFKARVLGAGGEVQLLHVNFRSVSAILEEVERIVAPVMHAEEGVQPPFEKLLACDRLRDEAGFDELGRAPVEHWDCRSWVRPEGEEAAPEPAKTTLVGRAAEIEARAIARDVVRLNLDAGVPWGEFAILLRSGTHQEAYLRALRDAGIPFEVGKDKSYYRRREVIDAGALVRSVLDPHDHLALLTWLRSPAVGVPDAALIPLWTRHFPDLCTRLAGPGDESATALEALIAEAAAAVDDDSPGLDRIAGWERSLAFALQALGCLRAAFEDVEPDRFVQRLRTASGLEAVEAARWLGSYRAANLDRFFRELEEELLDAGTTRHDVLRRLRRAVSEERDAEEGRPRRENPDAVQLMTIHSAKGLDFGHVYLPRLDAGGKGGRGKDTDAALRDEGWELRLFQAETPGWTAAKEAARAVEQAERVRLLYVAATRAERRLVFSGMECSPADAPKATSAGELVAMREGGIADWREQASRAGVAVHGRHVWTERDALWSVCDLASGTAEPQRAGKPPGVVLPPPESAAADSERLAALRSSAGERSARPFVAAASALADEAPSPEHHEERAESLLGGAEEAPAADREGEGTRDARRGAPAPARGAARAAGTAVHRVLEVLDLDGDPQALLAGAAEAVEHARSLAGGRDAEASARSTRELLERVAAGVCATRLFELGSAGVLARELPVLLEPSGDEGPVGCFVGSIDLVYRDPESGEVVVADHKSDRVESDEEIAEAVRHHSPQLEVYRRAVQVGDAERGAARRRDGNGGRALRLPQGPRRRGSRAARRAHAGLGARDAGAGHLRGRGRTGGPTVDGG